MRLRKADVERLLRHLGDDDVDGLRADVAAALALCLDLRACSFDDAVRAAGIAGGWPAERVAALLDGDAEALGDLATELAEERDVRAH